MCRTDVPLREHTWYGLGGPARWFLTPRDAGELAEIVRRCRQHGLAWRLLGQGANLLVRDAGFDGAVIHLSGPNWERVEFDDEHGAPTETLVSAGAGAHFPRLVKKCADRGLIGLENLAGIPGSLGGIVRMNAGGRHGNISQYVRTVHVLEPDGELRTRTRAETGFAYRHTALAGCVVLGATLALERGDPRRTLARFREIWQAKAASQPAVAERSCGCIFKNPPPDRTPLSAGALIDRAGLKGTRVGGAEVSPRHANFIVAHAGATAADVLELVELVKRRVAETAGVELELEVEIW